MSDVRKDALDKLDAQVISIEIEVLTDCHAEFKATKDPRFAEVTLKAADRISRHRGLNAPDKTAFTDPSGLNESSPLSGLTAVDLLVRRAEAERQRAENDATKPV